MDTVLCPTCTLCDTGTLGTSSLASSSTAWTPYMESPGNKTQCKAGQTDTVSDLQPVGHGRGGTVWAGGGTQGDG